MLAGRPYDPGDGELVALRRVAQGLMRDYNATIIGDKTRARTLTQLLGSWNGAVIRAPFHVDYGKNIHFGPGCFVNYGCFFMDICEIRIGARCQFGTAVQLLTEDRPHDVARRSKGQEWGRPISIGDDVWIGGNSVINPGVTVGSNTVIGSGSVVTRSIPSGVIAVGNPCRVLRPITDEDSRLWKNRHREYLEGGYQ